MRYVNEVDARMNKHYTIALCDILGFSKLVSRNKLEVIVNDVLGWLRKAVHFSINKCDWPETIPSFEEIDNNSNIGIVWFSDTILIYTREDSDQSLRELLEAVAWLLFSTNISTTRIRAGIAYGEAFIDPQNAMYVGQTIVEAYQMEQKQQWSGAALTESAVERVPEPFRHGTFADWPIVPYKVPLKNSETISTLAINWTYGIHSHLSLNWSKKRDAPSPEDWIKNRSVCEKWKNTRQFHLDVCKHCRRLDKNT